MLSIGESHVGPSRLVTADMVVSAERFGSGAINRGAVSAEVRGAVHSELEDQATLVDRILRTLAGVFRIAFDTQPLQTDAELSGSQSGSIPKNTIGDSHSGSLVQMAGATCNLSRLA